MCTDEQFYTSKNEKPVHGPMVDIDKLEQGSAVP
jgi:hypothetical protein